MTGDRPDVPGDRTDVPGERPGGPVGGPGGFPDGLPGEDGDRFPDTGPDRFGDTGGFRDTDPEGGAAEPVASDDPDRRRDDAAVRRSDERVRHSDPAVRAALRRRRRRTNRIYAGLGAALIVVLIGYVALYFLPVFAVRQVQVVGTTTVPVEAVTERAAVTPGTPLLQVDTHAVARRVAGIPRVDEVTVTRDYPSGLRISLVERTALVVVEVDGAQHLVDGQGIDFGQGEAPPGTPLLTVGDEAGTDLPGIVRDLATVFAEVRGTAGQEIASVHVETPASIVLTLADGRVVEWGAAGRDHEKAVALRMVLEQPGQTWNVSNPALPASR